MDLRLRRTVLTQTVFTLAGCVLLGGCFPNVNWLPNRSSKQTPQQRLQQIAKTEEQQLKSAKDPRSRFYALAGPAKRAVNTGDYAKAQRYATELLQAAPQYFRDWNYGNAIHDGNLVLGRVALRKGNKQAAIKYLLAAGKTPGSPQLNSFGPNMSLAKDLIAKGEKTAVLQYFDECKAFWSMDYGNLKTWKSDVQAGRMPDFGANLLY